MARWDGSVAATAAKERFAAELRQWRLARGWSKRDLAIRMSFHPSYVSHLEAGRHWPTEEFASRADRILDANGEILRSWRECEELRRYARARAASSAAAAQPFAVNAIDAATNLLIERDEAEQHFDGSVYRMTMRRSLRNLGQEPIVQYPIRISVDQFPEDPARSQRLYRADPLTWDELALSALCIRKDGSSQVAHTMTWRADVDTDALKEIWLQLRNEDSRFPLYPGERCLIEYSYRVPEGKWGHWFQRAVRWSTQYLRARLVFPVSHDPGPANVWATEITKSSERYIRLATGRTEVDELYYECAVENPPLDVRYRLEWRFADRSGVGPVNRPPHRGSRGPLRYQ